MRGRSRFCSRNCSIWTACRGGLLSGNIRDDEDDFCMALCDRFGQYDWWRTKLTEPSSGWIGWYFTLKKNAAACRLGRGMNWTRVLARD